MAALRAAAEDVLAAAPGWSVRAGAAPMALGIALHLGRVMYGNIGGRARLDFTAIGLGAHALKGVREPREILTVHAASGLASG